MGHTSTKMTKILSSIFRYTNLKFQHTVLYNYINSHYPQEPEARSRLMTQFSTIKTLVYITISKKISYICERTRHTLETVHTRMLCVTTYIAMIKRVQLHCNKTTKKNHIINLIPNTKIYYSRNKDQNSHSTHSKQ